MRFFTTFLLVVCTSLMVLCVFAFKTYANGEDTIVVGGGEDWYAVPNEDVHLFCGANLCSNRVVIVIVGRDIRRIYINDKLLWGEFINIGDFIDKCGNWNNIEYVEYYHTTNAPLEPTGILWGLDIYLHLSDKTESSSKGALLQIDLENSKVKGECGVELR